MSLKNPTKEQIKRLVDRIEIDKNKLEKTLGIPVVLTAARSGIGMDELQDTLNKVMDNEYDFKNKPVYYDYEIENIVTSIKEDLKQIIPSINPRWLGLRLIDGDESILTSLNEYTDEDILDDLIPILTGYYSIEDVEKSNCKDKQLFLDTIKQIGLFLTNFSETTEQYKSILKEIKDLKQEEYELKKKIGIE